MTRLKHPLLWICFGIALLRWWLYTLGDHEFKGWFTHVYYYYVEVRGLLQQGELPYPDLPLLFYLYAGLSKLLMAFGLEMDTAIVYAVRCWMSILPALLPIPIYGMAQQVTGNEKLSFRFWVLVAAAGLLPLTMVHMPAFLQKNLLGFLWLGSLLYFVRAWLSERRQSSLWWIALMVGAICLTHFGTVAALLLYAFATLIAYLFVQPQKGKLFPFIPLMIGLLALALGSIRYWDEQRFDRIFYYLSEGLSGSFLGQLFGPGHSLPDRLLALLGIGLPLLLFGYLYRVFRKHRSSHAVADQVFWLSQIIFSYSLVAPWWDQLLLARLALFMSLSILVLLFYNDAYFFKTCFWQRLSWMAIAGSLLFFSFAEWMSSQMHNRNSAAVWQDIQALQSQLTLQENDLILGRNGVEHLCNWYFGTKAGVITSLHRQDFERYDHIYVLNPAFGDAEAADLERRQADNEVDRYFFMRHNIPPPASATVTYESDSFTLFEMPVPPPKWTFSSDGHWSGYGL